MTMGRLKHLGGSQLLDVCLGDALLLVAGVEDLRAVLRAFIGTLTIQFRRIVSHREVNLQKLAEGDLRGIEGDLDGLGVAGGAGAHDFIMRIGFASASVSCNALPTHLSWR